MPVNRYRKAIEIVRTVRKAHKTNLFPRKALIEEIYRQAGADLRLTVQPYLQLMQDMKMVEQVGNRDTWKATLDARHN